MAGTPRIEIRSNFRRYERELEDAQKRALKAGAQATATAAAAVSTGYRIQAIMSNTDVSNPQPSRRGFAVRVRWPDFRALWFEKGTLQRRRTKLKESTVKRRATASGQARLAHVGESEGVKAVRFMQKGLRAGKAVFYSRLLAEVGRAGRGLR